MSAILLGVKLYRKNRLFETLPDSTVCPVMATGCLIQVSGYGGSKACPQSQPSPFAEEYLESFRAASNTNLMVVLRRKIVHAIGMIPTPIAVNPIEISAIKFPYT